MTSDEDLEKLANEWAKIHYGFHSHPLDGFFAGFRMAEKLMAEDETAYNKGFVDGVKKSEEWLKQKLLGEDK